MELPLPPSLLRLLSVPNSTPSPDLRSGVDRFFPWLINDAEFPTPGKPFPISLWEFLEYVQKRCSVLKVLDTHQRITLLNCAISGDVNEDLELRRKRVWGVWILLDGSSETGLEGVDTEKVLAWLEETVREVRWTHVVSEACRLAEKLSERSLKLGNGWTGACVKAFRNLLRSTDDRGEGVAKEIVAGAQAVCDLFGRLNLKGNQIRDVAECLCSVRAFHDPSQALWECALGAVRQILKGRKRFVFLESLMNIVSKGFTSADEALSLKSAEARRTAILFISDTTWGQNALVPLADEVDLAEILNTFQDALKDGALPVMKGVEVSIRRLMRKWGVCLSTVEWNAVIALLQLLKTKFDALTDPSGSNEPDSAVEKPDLEALADEIARYHLEFLPMSSCTSSAGALSSEKDGKGMGSASTRNDDSRISESKAERIGWMDGSPIASSVFDTATIQRLDNVMDIYKNHLPLDKAVKMVGTQAARLSSVPVFDSWIDGLQRIVTFYFVRESRIEVQFAVLHAVRAALWACPSVYADAVITNVLATFCTDDDVDFEREVVAARLKLFMDAACLRTINLESMKMLVLNIQNPGGGEAFVRENALSALNCLKELFIARMQLRPARYAILVYDALTSDAFLKSPAKEVREEVLKFLRCLSVSESCSVRVKRDFGEFCAEDDVAKVSGRGRSSMNLEIAYVESPFLKSFRKRARRKPPAEDVSGSGILDISDTVQKLADILMEGRFRSTEVDVLKTLQHCMKSPFLVRENRYNRLSRTLLQYVHKGRLLESSSTKGDQKSSSSDSEALSSALDILYEMHGMHGVSTSSVLSELVRHMRMDVKRLYEVTTVLSVLRIAFGEGEDTVIEEVFSKVLTAAEYFIIERRRPASHALEKMSKNVTEDNCEAPKNGYKASADKFQVPLDSWDFALVECLSYLVPILSGLRRISEWAKRIVKLIVESVALGHESRRKVISRTDLDTRRRWRQLAYYLCSLVTPHVNPDIRRSLMQQIMNDATNGNALAKAVIESSTFFADIGYHEAHEFCDSDPVFLIRDKPFSRVVTLKMLPSLGSIDICQFRATGNIRYTVSTAGLGVNPELLHGKLRNSELDLWLPSRVPEEKRHVSSKHLSAEAPLETRSLPTSPHTAREKRFVALEPLSPGVVGEARRPRSRLDQEPKRSLDLTGLLTRLGFGPSFSIELLKGKRDKIARTMKTLTYYHVTGTHRIAVAFVGRENRDENSVLANRTGDLNYVQFVRALGDLRERTSTKRDVFMGGFSRMERRAEGPYFIHWREGGRQMTFHVSSMMWNTGDDDSENCGTEKKKLLGNDHVRIVYSESGNIHDVDMIRTRFKTVRIMVTPASKDLFSVTVLVEKPHTRCADIPFFGPLYPRADPHLVPKQLLPGLVRVTALHAHVACLAAGLPFVPLNWEYRDKLIEQFDDDSFIKPCSDMKENL